MLKETEHSLTQVETELRKLDAYSQIELALYWQALLDFIVLVLKRRGTMGSMIKDYIFTYIKRYENINGYRY